MPAAEQPFGDYDLDPALLAVLTEYEEHRLKENIREGRQLYRILASFPLLSIDLELEQLKTCLKPVGEVITYVPGSPSNQWATFRRAAGHSNANLLF